MYFYSRSFAPRKSSKLFKLVTAMVQSGRAWTYGEMSEFGFKLNHARDYDKKNDRGYWSENLNWAKGSYYITKNEQGLYYVTEPCKRAM